LVLMTTILLCDQIEKNKKVTGMEREKVHTRFWWGNLRERDHLENPGVDGSIILMWIFRR